MRILIAHYRPDIVSGAELALADFVDQALAAAPGGGVPRFHFTMLVPGEGALAAYYRSRGYEVWVRRVETPRRIAPGLHTLQSLLLAPQLIAREYQMVLCNTFAAASRVMTAARRARLPCAVYVREYIQDRPRHRVLLEQADGILVVSADLGRHLSAFPGFGARLATKIRLAYDPIAPGPILQRVERHRLALRGGDAPLLPFKAGEPVVGLVGRITPFKQQDLFVQAAARVLAEVPQARFAIVGAAQESDRAYENHVRDLVARLGLQDRVVFLGQRKENVEIISEFSLLCLTSTREPLGRVILEAHLAGTPVVCSNVGGPGEIVVDGVTGLLFPPTGPQASEILAAKIICLLKDPFLARRLAAHAAERIHETFASLKHVRAIAQHLVEIGARVSP